MLNTKEQTKASDLELEKLIDKAIKKVHAAKENDLCKYLPGPAGGYIHHFTLRKLKHADPSRFTSLIQEFIIDSERPVILDPKPRAPRGSRKRKEIISFTRTDVEKVLELARKAGDKDLLAKFSPKRPLAAIKRDLIRSIRREEISEDLWHCFVEAVLATKKSCEC